MEALPTEPAEPRHVASSVRARQSCVFTVWSSVVCNSTFLDKTTGFQEYSRTHRQVITCQRKQHFFQKPWVAIFWENSYTITAACYNRLQIPFYYIAKGEYGKLSMFLNALWVLWEYLAKYTVARHLIEWRVNLWFRQYFNIAFFTLEECDKIHDDVIKWNHFPHYWPFVRGIHRLPANSPHKGQWRGALMFALICVRKNGWVNNREAGDLRRHRAHYDVTVMSKRVACSARNKTSLVSENNDS